MKIAVVLNTSWNVYNFRLGLINALREDGHEVVILAPHDKYSDRLENLGYQFYPVRMDSRGVNPIKDAGLVVELYKLYKQISPDVILHYTVKPNVYGSLAARAAGIPMINNVCGLGTVFLKKSWVSIVAKTLYKVAFRFPHKVFFQNHDDFQLFVREHLIKSNIADTVPGSGIDLKKFEPTVSPEDVHEKKFTFLVISRLIYDKGIIEYVEAIKKLKAKGVDAEFQILGAKDPVHKRGIPLNIVDRWIKEGLFDYLGTTDDVKAKIEMADCVVLPSYREGLPRTLLEAASLGKPIITTNTAGCKHVVDDNENGFLCEVRSSDDLAEKMLKMLGLSQIERKKMGEKGRVKVKTQFDETIVISKYQEVINHLAVTQGKKLIA
ncbi:glycosyltransferase involved in cell wall biosynthesis [Catalinimonas alkaloidigena]|uniref:glycosyltransferase family 4 protein n=1 Tax=Catalinimonas alkaloidigena TaxID=1075417 RepID=UPI00240549B8|nr:glycosyltransferase family 4 protein [Catalinimonas alkaloidigena]MDF9799454.1 glycosyltransferase involved in cell wall biosynthesis [Catalinimonas alkaloidigena]